MRLAKRARTATRILRQEGVQGLVGRVASKAATRWGDSGERIHLRADDVVDSTLMASPPPGERRAPGETLTIGWVLTAPGPASGGHTTIFRFVEALEAAGHRCLLYIYDGQGGPAAGYESLIRTWWPRVKAEVRDLATGVHGCDAYVATAWPTAHVLAGHGSSPGKRFYLIQDYEPYFYARGAAYELAEETYRFGFIPLTVGHMVADELRKRFDLNPIVAEFGCDTRDYSVTNRGTRDGVVFYTKPGVARRGYEMGVLALEQFHRRSPETPIHTFGMQARRLPFPAVVHGHMPPRELNSLYNACSVGLALSFTNISLIANELLAAGVVPVVNDYSGTRADLNNPFVAWSRSTPTALADAIFAARTTHETVGSDRLSQSVSSMSWVPAQRAVVEAIERECTMAATDSWDNQ